MIASVFATQETAQLFKASKRALLLAPDRGRKSKAPGEAKRNPGKPSRNEKAPEWGRQKILRSLEP